MMTNQQGQGLDPSVPVPTSTRLTQRLGKAPGANCTEAKQAALTPIALSPGCRPARDMTLTDWSCWAPPQCEHWCWTVLPRQSLLLCARQQ